jgi:hypothetical protein
MAGGAVILVLGLGMLGGGLAKPQQVWPVQCKGVLARRTMTRCSGDVRECGEADESKSQSPATQVLQCSVMQCVTPPFSHDVKYGSGSGQQSVTGTGQQEDVNSHWLLKGPEEGDYCRRGEPVACGQRVRLEHLTTSRLVAVEGHRHHRPSAGTFTPTTSPAR